MQSFEDFLYDYEVDVFGLEGTILPGTPEMDKIYRGWLDQNKSTRSGALSSAAETRASNAKKGITQKNLTGSTKQKQWAAEIRGSLINSFSEENKEYFATEVMSAKFWIERRLWTGRELSEQIDARRAKCVQADALANSYRRKHMTAEGVMITQEFEILRDASRKAWRAFNEFMDGN